MFHVRDLFLIGHHLHITQTSHTSHTWSHLHTSIFLFIGSSWHPSFSLSLAPACLSGINLLSFLFSPIFSVADPPYGVYSWGRAGDLSIGCCREERVPPLSAGPAPRSWCSPWSRDDRITVGALSLSPVALLRSPQTPAFPTCGAITGQQQPARQ